MSDEEYQKLFLRYTILKFCIGFFLFLVVLTIHILVEKLPTALLITPGLVMGVDVSRFIGKK